MTPGVFAFNITLQYWCDFRALRRWTSCNQHYSAHTCNDKTSNIAAVSTKLRITVRTTCNTYNISHSQSSWRVHVGIYMFTVCISLVSLDIPLHTNALGEYYKNCEQKYNKIDYSFRFSSWNFFNCLNVDQLVSNPTCEITGLDHRKGDGWTQSCLRGWWICGRDV